MRHKALIRRLQISCLGLDRIDPLCLLVDDVIEALAQPQRTWVGLTKEEVLEFTRASWGVGVTASEFIRAIEAKLKDKNDVAQKTNS